MVAGELARASGLGEAARLMLHALPLIGVRTWPLEAGHRWQGVTCRRSMADGRRRGAPLALHINSPQVPTALLRLPRGVLRGRMVIGCWAWELPTVPPAWRIGVRLRP